jgi:ketosteroid isomerase-like protein
VTDVPTDRNGLVRSFYAAWSADDLDGVLAVVHPDIDFRPILGVLYERDGYHGHDGMTEHLRHLQARWDSFEAEVELTREVGDGLVAFVCLTATRGGQAYDARIAVDVGFRDGLIVSFVGRDIWETAQELGIEL